MSALDYQYRVLQKSHSTAVYELLRDSFFKDEPLGVALGAIKSSHVSRWLPKYVESILEEQVSVGAFDNDELVGVSVNVVENYTGLIKCVDPKLEPEMYQVARFLHLLHAGLDIYKELNLARDSKFFAIVFLTVRSDFAGKGIASMLAIQSEELARNIGTAAIGVDATSAFSYKIYKSLGYNVLRKMQYSELKHEGTGKQVIDSKNIDQIHNCAQVMSKVFAS